jgi:hypothetical protein
MRCGTTTGLAQEYAYNDIDALDTRWHFIACSCEFDNGDLVTTYYDGKSVAATRLTNSAIDFALMDTPTITIGATILSTTTPGLTVSEYTGHASTPARLSGGFFMVGAITAAQIRAIYEGQEVDRVDYLEYLWISFANGLPYSFLRRRS